MRMKAADLHAQGRPRLYAGSHLMTIDTVALDPPGPGKAWYKISGAGVCDSDLSTIENLARCHPRGIPGHEAAGIVEEVGPGVIGRKQGDHVVSMFVRGCGDCRFCNNGGPNPCQSAAGRLVSDARAAGRNGQPGTTARFSFRLAALVTDEKSNRGSDTGSCVPKRDIPPFHRAVSAREAARAQTS